MSVHSDSLQLLQKYDLPLPRYTSYPTVPHWNPDSFSVDAWKQAVVDRFVNERGEVCIYIHLPFCEELCTYCACNKRITKNHKVETPYLETVLKEWSMYRDLFPMQPVIREIHLGGGTPTFFSPENLVALINGITMGCKIAEDHEFSVEVHPNYTSRQHLEALYSVGFNRISLGVQDFDPVVQYIINREQSFEQTNRVVEIAHELGYSSINMDLIYGLPRQTTESIRMTIEKVCRMKPDRIAFYSYAHVPWKSKGQRRYTDEDVPRAAEKLAMYDLGNQLLTEAGFVSIGMDHFALPDDALMKAVNEGRLHRNFMGYTTTNHKLVIGLGASSISDSWTMFAQNEKTVERYSEMIAAGQWPFIGGHRLSEKDLEIRQYILDLMCCGSVELPENVITHEMNDQWSSMEEDGLLIRRNNFIEVTPKGKLFIRNIASVIDAYLLPKNQTTSMFSKAI